MTGLHNALARLNGALSGGSRAARIARGCNRRLFTARTSRSYPPRLKRLVQKTSKATYLSVPDNL